MRWLLILLILSSMIMVAAEQNETRYGTGTYYNPFLRTPNYVINFTANYSKLPWPKITWRAHVPIAQRGFDTLILPNETYEFNPLSCEGEIAQCYHVLQHEFTSVITRGKNYSAISDYILPEDRVKTFVCVGNDTECTSKAFGCFCPEETPYARRLPRRTVDCPLEGNICEVTASGALTVCRGNFTSCLSQYERCGCGRKAICTAGKATTCINGRNELEICKGTMSQCIDGYDICFCGTEMMALQAGCTKSQHLCDGEICIGSFGECAVKHDVCQCGT